MRGRRRFLRHALAALAASPAWLRAASSKGPVEDFDVLWRALDEGYAYFDGREPAWREARARWRPKAAAAKSREALVAVLESALAELQDESIVLGAHAPASPRPFPFATDVWGEWVGADAMILAVRAGSVADVAGLAPGLRVTAIRGQPIEQAVRGLLPRARQGDAAARNWALRRLLAGPWSGEYDLAVVAGGRPRRVVIAREDSPPAAQPPLIARRIGEHRDLGYLRLKDNLGDAGLVMHFDAALQHLRDTKGLLLDLRETPSGGTPAVARALLARFTVSEAAWIVRRARGDVRTAPPADRVVPRGPFAYAGTVAVLVDRWTAGEGESLALGLETVARATLVGTGMAGVRGDAKDVPLPGSGIVLRFPSTRVLHVNGTPREAFRPALPVDIVAPSGGPGDPILYQGLKFLEARSAPASPRA